MAYYEDELTDRAVRAYFLAAKHAGRDSVDQPSRADSGPVTHEGRQYIQLANVNGTLAWFRVTNQDRLKRLKRWPAALEAT